MNSTNACPKDDGNGQWVQAPKTLKCYRLLRQSLSHVECTQKCGTNSTLAVIESDTESDFVLKKVLGKDKDVVAWIGLYQEEDTEDAKKGWNSWTSNRTIEYRNWGFGTTSVVTGAEPNDDYFLRADCAAIRAIQKGKWSDEVCTMNFRCLCEFPAKTSTAYPPAWVKAPPLHKGNAYSMLSILMVPIVWLVVWKLVRWQGRRKRKPVATFEVQGSDTKAKTAQFRKARHAKKKRALWGVLQAGMIDFGIGLFMMMALVRGLLPVQALTFVNSLIFAGLMTLSTVDVDIDEFARHYPRMTNIAALGLVTTSQLTGPPYVWGVAALPFIYTLTAQVHSKYCSAKARSADSKSKSQPIVLFSAELVVLSLVLNSVGNGIAIAIIQTSIRAALGGFEILSGIAMAGIWFGGHRFGHSGTTDRFWLVCYFWVVEIVTQNECFYIGVIFSGVSVAVAVHEGAVMIILPVFVLLIVVPPIIAYHRDSIFSLMARRFEGAQGIEDGAFMAALLEESEFEVGQEYWHWLGEGNEDVRFADGDHRRHFVKGVVCAIEPERIVNGVKESGCWVDIKRKTHHRSQAVKRSQVMQTPVTPFRAEKAHRHWSGPIGMVKSRVGADRHWSGPIGMVKSHEDSSRNSRGPILGLWRQNRESPDKHTGSNPSPMDNGRNLSGPIGGLSKSHVGADRHWSGPIGMVKSHEDSSRNLSGPILGLWRQNRESPDKHTGSNPSPMDNGRNLSGPIGGLSKSRESPDKHTEDALPTNKPQSKWNVVRQHLRRHQLLLAATTKALDEAGEGGNLSPTDNSRNLSGPRPVRRGSVVTRAVRRGSVAMSHFFDAKERVWVKAAPRRDAQDLMETALASLKCVKFSSIPSDIFVFSQHPKSSAQPFKPTTKSPKIDFFVSHSHHDDPDAKYKALCAVADEFQQQNGREATFWMDSLCLFADADGKDDISMRLKCLPVFIQSCHKVLVLPGPTYPFRLWCVWELYTLFAFAPRNQILGRLCLQPLHGDSAINISDVLKAFSFKNAKCFDPNEQAKLRHVVEQVGMATFEVLIHEIGKTMGGVAMREV